jgi:two-component system response regulator HydG
MAKKKKGQARQQSAITPLAQIEKKAILDGIKSMGGDKLGAAKKLGIGKTTIYRKLKEYGKM